MVKIKQAVAFATTYSGEGRIKALAIFAAIALAVGGVNAASIWDGNFNDNQNGVLMLNGNSLSEDSNTITIDQPYKGVSLDYVSGTTSMTVVFRYRGLTAGAKDKVVVAASVAGTAYDRAGFRYTTGGQVGCVWNSIGTPNTGGYLQSWRESDDLYLSGELPERGYIAFSYTANGGAAIYYRRETDESFKEAYHNRESLWYLHSINDNGKGVYGMMLGGCRQEPASSLMNAQGMQITAIAHLYNGENINDVRFDSSATLEMEGGEIAVSAVNAQIAEGTRILTLKVAPGATIDLDEPFAVEEVYFVSEGDLALTADSAPSSSEIEKMDFYAVAGSVTRDWQAYLSGTGAYLTEEAQPAFKRTTLAQLDATRPLRVNMGGGWLVNGPATLFCRSEGRDDNGSLTNITYLAQRVDDGRVKCVALELTQVGDDVWARAYGARNTTTLGNFGATFTGSGTSLAKSDSADGYGLYGIGLVDAADCRSICVNFTKDANSRIASATALGLAGYVADSGAWNNVAGANGTYTVQMGGYGEGEAAFAAACGANVHVVVSGSSGAYHNTETYPTAGASPLRGYIDENSIWPKPAVKISNIPFAAYRVVVYCSTDTKDAKFGHVTINGTDYTAADGATTRGDAVWGASRVATATEGTNVLVSDVLSGSVVIVGGHRGSDSSVRGCIAAVQIVKCDEEDVVPLPCFGLGVKGEIASSADGYVVTAKEGETLDEADFAFTIDKKAFNVGIAADGKSAFVALKSPYEVEKDEGAADGIWTENGDGTVTLNVEVVPGLYYAAASAASLNALKCPGADSPATAETTLTVEKPESGTQGFFKVWVSDKAIKAE